MFCKECGKEIKEGAAFCSNCGTAVAAATATAETAAPVAPAETTAPAEAATTAVPAAPAEATASVVSAEATAPTEATAPVVTAETTTSAAAVLQGTAQAVVTENVESNAVMNVEPGNENNASADATVNANAGSAVGDNAQGAVKKKKKKKGGLVAIIIVLVLAIGAGTGAALYFTGDYYKSRKNLKLANACYEDEEYKDALEYYKAALDYDDTLLEAYLNSADIYLRDGDYDKAADLLKKAVKKFKKADDEEAVEKLSGMLVKVYLEGIDREMGAYNFDKAHELAEKGLEDTGDKAFSKKQVEIYAAEADYHMQTYTSYSYYEALYVLEKGYDATGDDTLMQKRMEVYLAAADDYVRNGQYDSALNMLESGYYATGGTALMDRSVEIYLEYAEIYASQQDYDRAIKILSQGQQFAGAEKLASRMNMLIAERDALLSPYTTLKDPLTGQTYDLGGMEIVIYDWFSSDKEPQTEYEIAHKEYREWAQKTYNFSVREIGEGYWGNFGEYQDYVLSGGDDMNYVFCLPPTTNIDYGDGLLSVMQQGLMYDLSTLDCLDFSAEQYARSVIPELASGPRGEIYAMPRLWTNGNGGDLGIFFNKQILRDANIDPDSLYQLEASGDWTWEMFEEYCSHVSGASHALAMGDRGQNHLRMAAVFSNNGEYIGRENGRYVDMSQSENTLAALKWTDALLDTYNYVPKNADWDYGQDAFIDGESAFYVGYVYESEALYNNMQDDYGFVVFPKGSQADDYRTAGYDNWYVIPACYSMDRAWNIAFAFNQWNMSVPGWEGKSGEISPFSQYFRDGESVKISLDLISKSRVPDYSLIVSDIDDANNGW